MIKTKIDVTPEAKYLWLGIGGHFDSFTQIMCEFIDNGISNYNRYPSIHKNMIITIDETPIPERDEVVRVTIEDQGTGIIQLQTAFRLGDITARQSNLNEHGFGFKHAIATANPENDSWEIHTRTEDDLLHNEYSIIKAPYSFEMETETINNAITPWKGTYTGTGTLIKFCCSKQLFRTLKKGNVTFKTLLDYLKLDLGYIYSEKIKAGEISIMIRSNTCDYYKMVSAIEPNWVGYYKPKKGKIKKDLGGGDVEIEFTFGEVREHKESKRHYQKNMATSGVEIRINGRLLEDNFFPEIWGIERHNDYNHFLVQINIKSDNPDALPKTRTSKNGIRSGDEKLDSLVDWIKSTMPKPEKKTSSQSSERDLVKAVVEEKRRNLERFPDAKVEDEFYVYKSVNAEVRVDLYVFDSKNVLLYEAKKGQADIKSLYQLLMYWDGAVSDGLKPTEGILLADSFSEGVLEILESFNNLFDENGQKKYNFKISTWEKEAGIRTDI